MQAENSTPPPPLAVRKARRPLISLTPLIDVVFILLIFFMLSTSLTQWRAVDLPAASNRSTAADEEPSVLVDLFDGGELRVDGRATDPANLIESVTEAMSSHSAKRVFLRPHAGVDLQATVSMLDRLAEAKAGEVSLVRVAR